MAPASLRRFPRSNVCIQPLLHARHCQFSAIDSESQKLPLLNGKCQPLRYSEYPVNLLQDPSFCLDFQSRPVFCYAIDSFVNYSCPELLLCHLNHKSHIPSSHSPDFTSSSPGFHRHRRRYAVRLKKLRSALRIRGWVPSHGGSITGLLPPAVALGCSCCELTTNFRLVAKSKRAVFPHCTSLLPPYLSTHASTCIACLPTLT
ncbi:hypothetical protein BKA67DRAFT_269794 [Truncatella angustata]|uniref:Uncharacterized protein n=1 Tax=Truncatella angustata TaxID=152316 RepID=A0A9P8UL41_9PEZI|nr:uncharacterized protein BKA67DRAFT_269794 [Truncatella angustata]KAH6654098.1 hypothetical protein BKA67DRAFT_269794 [Truncatella angustata]